MEHKHKFLIIIFINILNFSISELIVNDRKFTETCSIELPTLGFTAQRSFQSVGGLLFKFFIINCNCITS